MTLCKQEDYDKSIMVFHKIKNMHKTLFYVFLSLVLTLLVSSSYGFKTSRAATFQNNQSHAVLADDLYNSCKSGCPTEQQTVFKKNEARHNTTQAFSGTTPPSLAIRISAAQISLFAVATFLYVYIYASARPRFSLYVNWRD